MNQPRKFSSKVPLLIGAGILVITLLPALALARVGGGQSYGGGSHGGGGGGGAGALIWMIFQVFRLLLWLTIDYPIIGIPLDIIVAGLVCFYFFRKLTGGKRAVEKIVSSGATAVAPTAPAGGQTAARGFDQLRRFDPNFSDIIFTDFCYALYGKAHDARGRGAQTLDLFSPYLSEEARGALLQRNPNGLKEVKGIIVGALEVIQVSGLDTPVVRISVGFETNYTEVIAGAKSDMSYYVRERWELERKRDVLSPPPAQATALHCPRCGAPLQKDTVGACAFCQTKIDSGEFQWYVRSIALLSREERGPLLTENVPEVGTDYPTMVQPGFENVQAQFAARHPEFSWGEFEGRAALIFNELQGAWSTLNWERARPHETDNIFQMHQYWIDAYKRQGLRNVLNQYRITAMQPVKIKEDAFYNAITLRIFAEGYDFTIDGNGVVVSGSKTSLRRWSEYWTFIRNRQAKPAPARADLNCPNCGAPLKVNATGVCEFCNGKITSGDFDWVLSRIEQDESYAG